MDDGNKEIESAIKHQTAARKKQCCILMIFLVIMGVMIGAFMIATS